MNVTRAFARLRGMPPSEVAARAAMGTRRGIDRLAWKLRPQHWDRGQLADALDTGQPGMPAIATCLRRSEWRAAHAGLSDLFARREPRFVLAPAARAGLAHAIRAQFPDAASEAGRRGDTLLSGRADLLGYRNLLVAARDDGAAGVNWQDDPVNQRTACEGHWSEVPYLSPECGDHKVIWELNRHQQWLMLGRAWCLTGEARYRDGFVHQLHGWMSQNPPESGINWASMLELAIRGLSWVWALHLFAQPQQPGTPATEPPWTVDLLLGLHRQLSLVEHNLSTFFSPNTHLLGEALGLYVAGRSLPELRRASAWAQLGRQVLLDEMDHQIHADGGHVELSLHYHRYTLDFYLLALSIARLTHDSHAAARFADGVLRLARFAKAMADDRALLPRIGDDDGGMLFPMCGTDMANVGDSLSLAAVLLDRPELGDGRAHESVAWMTGRVQPPMAGTPAVSMALTASGYAVSRNRRGDHLVMDVGPLGFKNGGHAHADALSLTLSVAGTPLLIDPGTYCYTVDPEARDRFRCTPYHNTVTVDHRSQSQPAGPFQWSSAARATLDAWRSNQAFDFVEAAHDGYAPVIHTRQVLSRPGCWIVVDWLHGDTRAHAAAHWHLDPQWTTLHAASGAVRADHPSGARVWVLALHAAIEIVRGSEDGDALGWCAPVYGQRLPTTTLRLSSLAPNGHPIVTLIVESVEAPVFDALRLGDADDHDALGTGFMWTGTGTAETVMAARPGAVRRRRRAQAVATDARFMAWRQSEGPGTDALWVVDGTEVDVAGRLGVSALHGIPDLHVACGPDGPLVTSSHPVEALGLRVHGATGGPASDRADRLMVKG